MVPQRSRPYRKGAGTRDSHSRDRGPGLQPGYVQSTSLTLTLLSLTKSGPCTSRVSDLDELTLHASAQATAASSPRGLEVEALRLAVLLWTATLSHNIPIHVPSPSASSASVVRWTQITEEHRMSLYHIAIRDLTILVPYSITLHGSTHTYTALFPKLG